MPIVTLLLVAVAAIGLACAERRATEPQTLAPAATSTAPTGPVVTTTPASSGAPDRKTVADRVTIDGRSYRIDVPSASSTTLWRDFMPISPPNGRPLAASITVMAEDGQAFPTTITSDHLWVFGPDIWEADPSEVRRSPVGGTPASRIEVLAGDGPKWDPGIKVDVVVRLRTSTGTTYLLRLLGVTIERTS